MKILVLNAGSSSCKYKLYEMNTQTSLCSGTVERIGEAQGRLTHKIEVKGREEKIVVEEAFADHAAAMNKVINLIRDPVKGVISDMKEIAAIGHRVLHGGCHLTAPALVNEKVKKTIAETIPLGPLHNPANLMGIEVAEKLFPGVPNVAVFDTAFGMSMPPEAYTYALPQDLCEELHIRRYGFHGTSHTYLVERLTAQLKKPQDAVNCITLHLGNGSSMGCVKNGKCIDTSMGLTPLEGLVMGTRCGSVDPAIGPFLMKEKGLTADEVDTIFNKKSGMLGLCGMIDMRDVHTAVEKGDKKALLAKNILIRTIRKQLGAYFFLLEGKVDAMVFSAGIGENDDVTRAGICAGLEGLGIKMDFELNKKRSGEERLISTPDSKVKIFIIPTNEELQIALTAMRIVNG